MFVNSVSADVVGGAYLIAANYFKRTERIPVETEFFQPLFHSIVEDYRAGNKNKLRLANRAIARFETGAWSLSHEVA
jgi:hypothetical protein